MKRINSLSDLLMEELSDLLNAENQLTGALPKMAQASGLSVLKDTLEKYLKITRGHIDLLEGILGDIGQKPSNRVCKAIQNLIRESEGLVKKTERSSSLDAAIISVAQRAEQYEIVEYKKAREHAADLGHTRIVELFTKILNEKRTMNFHLNELAQGIINAQAGGFYIPEGSFSRGGIKQKGKGTDVSRFISEGNPNAQEQNSQNPEEQGDLS